MEFVFICKSCPKTFLHYKEIKSHGCRPQQRIKTTWNPKTGGALNPSVKTENYREPTQLNNKGLQEKRVDRISSVYSNEILLNQEERYKIETALTTAVESGSSIYEEPTNVLVAKEEEQEKINQMYFNEISPTQEHINENKTTLTPSVDIKNAKKYKILNISVPQEDQLNKQSITSDKNILSDNLFCKKKKNIKLTKRTIISCKKCLQSFCSKSSLNVHIKRLHSLNANFIYFCTIEGCESKFQKKRFFWKRVQEKHNEERKNSTRCHLCKQLFIGVFSRRNLQEHLLHPCPKKIKEEYICSKCGKKLGENASLKMHMRRHEEKYDFKCDACEMKFLNKSALKSHTYSRHITEGIFSCDKCGSKFKLNKYLKDHIRTHTGEKPFKCREGCEKSFRVTGTRASHERVHKEFKKFSCTFCPKKFKQQTTMFTHIKRHKGVKNHRCQVCGKTYVESSGARKCKHTRK